MTQRADILLPDGQTVSVPVEQAAKVAAATGGDVRMPAPEQESHSPIDTGFGLLPGSSLTDDLIAGPAARIFGAGRAATGGLTDLGLVEGAYILGGEKLRDEVRGQVNLVGKIAPKNQMAGEAAGLLLGPLGEVGGAVEGATAARVGEGLLGKALSMGARGATEGAIMGAGRQISEDELGDHELNGQQIFATAAKDALLGGALGGALGAGGHALTEAAGLLRRSPGPAAHGVLDEVAGVSGAGKELQVDARAQQKLIGDLQRAGATQEQAAIMADEIGRMAKTRVTLDAATLDAGLREAAPAAERPFEFGREIFPHGEGPSPGRVSLPSPDAGLHGRLGEASVADRPIRLTPNAPSWLGPESMQTPSVMEMMQSQGLKKAETALPPALSPNGEFPAWYGAFSPKRGPAGLALDGSLDALPIRGELPSPIRIARPDPGLKISEGTVLPREVRLGAESDLTRLETLPSPISIPKPGGGAPVLPPKGATQKTGLLSGALDEVAGQYAARRAGGDPELAEVLGKGYADRAARLAKQEDILNTHARKMADRGTTAFRKLEDTLNEVNFTERPDQIAKLVDPSRFVLARDAAVRMGQEVESVVQLLNSTATRGGGDVAVARLGRELKDFGSKMARLPLDGASPAATRDAFMSAYKLKQAVGKYSGFGKPEFLRTAAENEFAGVYERLRVGLEDESVWGAAGSATREWNEAFSIAKGRRDDFGRRFSVAIDQVSGVIKPELDAGKVKGMLGQLGGAEADQGVKTTEAFIDGLRGRAAAIEKYGELTPQRRALLADGRKALDEFETTFREAQRESEIVNRLKQQQSEEQGRGMGGLAGLVSDIITRPLTTMERLAQVRQTTRSLEKAVAGGLEKFFGAKGSKVLETLAPRSKADVAKEIGEIRELAGNPTMMQDRISRMVGDLAKHAPKVADEVRASAVRAITYLAREAPPATVRASIMGVHSKPRYSDQQISEWETKRRAALGQGKSSAPETIVSDMSRGKLNRDAIKAIEFVSPKLFAQVQEMAHAELERLEARGLLDKMPYQQKAAISTLLKVPADGTWKPDFIGLMQSVKAMPPPAPPPGAGPTGAGSKRAIKMDPGVFATEAQSIEEGMAA